MCNRHAFFSKMADHKYGQRYRGSFESTYGKGGKDLPANVEEFDDKYMLYFFAPGFDKSDFQVTVKDDTLMIIAKKKSSEADSDSGRWRRREFAVNTIERYFQLNEKIDKGQISAKYEDGILEVMLPKLAGFESYRQQIQVD